MTQTFSIKICGKVITKQDLITIKKEIINANPSLRAEIARKVCKKFNWVNAIGSPKLMSCRVGLLKLHRLGAIQLPPPLRTNGNGKGLIRQKVKLPSANPINIPINELKVLRLKKVKDKNESSLWNGLVDKYHYLGYQPLVGAQIRYLIESDVGILGCIGFGASAWKIAPRDQWIGWDSETRKNNLHLIINNVRFLILPWITIPNLASKILSICTRSVPSDFEKQYGYRPVLFETFVESQKYRGTCYKAANWKYIGKTKGRGKCDIKNKCDLPIKDIYVYPLSPLFRQYMGVSK